MANLKTLNMDISGLCSRMRKFIEEGLKCASANVEGVSEHDVVRLKSYLESAVVYKDWFCAQPELDCVETHPLEMDVVIHELSDIDAIENESVKDYCRIMWISQRELLDSQSSRLATNLISHDKLRFESFMEKVSKLISDYIEKILPLDLPESSPYKIGVDPGLTGINQ